MKVRRLEPRALLPWWRLAVGVGLLATLVLVVGPRQLAATFAAVEPVWACGVVALLCAWLLLGGFNVWLLINRLHPLELRIFLKVYLVSWATSLLLPGQLGDATQILFLRRHEVAMARSGAAYLVDKSISLGWLLLVATYGVGLHTPFNGGALLIFPVAFAVLGAAALFLLHRVRTREGSFWDRLKIRINRVGEHLWSFRHHPGTLALNISLTIAKWILLTFIYLGAFQAFGSSIDLLAAATIPVMSSLVGYIPITMGGVGTMEWTAVALFDRIGVEAMVVVSAFLFLRAVLLLLALFVLTFIKWK